MRHVELAHHFLKEKTTDGTCIVTKLRTEDNNLDIGTKRVPLPLFIFGNLDLKPRICECTLLYGFGNRIPKQATLYLFMGLYID
jgi:hypothetical protein